MGTKQQGASEPGGALAARISAPPPLVRDDEAADVASASLSELAEGATASGLEQVLKQPGCRDLLRGVFSGSQFLRDLATRDPDRLLDILTSDPDEKLAEYCTAVKSELANGTSQAEAMTALRRFRSSAALLIALADLGGVWGVEEATGALTDVADTAIQQALNFLLRAEAARGKLALQDEDDPANGTGLVILGMGKLGAHELNYSSDIDIIAFFEPETPAIPENGEAQQVFVRVVKGLVKLLQERTGDGYVFRVDLRLRPDPGSTTVAISVPAALNYYESLGQNWERAAMIKARPVAGDIAAGEGFLSEIRPFIWRKYLDYASIADVHAMKRQIHAHRGHGRIATAGHNIKLGRGGIREVEFFVQTQQLIAGGRQPGLRGRQTLQVLQDLAEAGWIDEAAADELAGAYCYLRRVEHRLQMRRDQQTHTLPEEGEDFEAFAAFCGHETGEAFAQELTEQLNCVQRHYSALFEDEPELAGEAGSLVFTGDDDDPDTLETLHAMGFASPKDVTRIVRGWHYGRYPAMRSARARERLTEMAPLLLRGFADTANPQAAFIAFDKFLSQLPAGVQLFSLLRANPSLLSLLIDIVGTAPRLAQVLSRHAQSLDALIDPDFFGGVPTAQDLEEHLDVALAQGRSYEETLDRARLFGQEQALLIGARVLSGSVAADRAGEAYANLANVLTDRLLQAAEHQLRETHGSIPGGRVAVLAMGKLGGMEMTAASDLDLILVYDSGDQDAQSDGRRPLGPAAYYARLTQRLLAALSAPTAEGSLYEVDMRLRPSGNSGPVATSLASFRTYHDENAWTWEHMALTRARVISGEPDFRKTVEADIAKVLTMPRQREATAKDVIEMRRRIDAGKGSTSHWSVKLVPGGLVDVEFIAQFLQLVHAAETPHVLDQNTAAALQKLHEVGKLQSGDAETLLAACALYHNLTQVLRLALEDDADVAAAPGGLHQLLSRAAALPDFATLEGHLRETQGEVVGIFEKILGAPPVEQ